MAISKTITLLNNFGYDSIFNNAYIKVDSIQGTKSTLGVKVGFYKQKDGDLLEYKNYVFAPNLDSDNFIKQAYVYLKTLPEFSNFTDC